MAHDLQEQLAQWIYKDFVTMQLLNAVVDAAPVESYLAAGAIRNLVWDRLHGFGSRTPLSDIDIIYHDAEEVSPEAEKKAERRLYNRMPGVKWQVRNQARMHERNREPAYLSIARAMQAWPETATAVGVRLTEEASLRFVSPWGLEDLFALRLRPSPLCANPDAFAERIRDKRWVHVWPYLTIER